MTKLTKRIGYHAAIRMNDGARRNRWHTWARAICGRLVRRFARPMAPAMDLVCGARFPQATTYVSRISAFQLHSRLHMAWHFHHHATMLPRTEYAGRKAEAAPSPLPASVPPWRGIAAVQKLPRTGRVTQALPIPFPPRIATLSKCSTLLIDRRERFLTQIASPPAGATSVAVTQTLAIAKVFRDVAIRTRRIEDLTQLGLAETIKLPAAARTAAAIVPHQSAAHTQAPARRLEEVVETVQVAPWLKLPAPPANINQIADQVIRQIDSRVIAWRERMGRI